MYDIKQAFSIAWSNFRQWHRNPRVIATFVLAFVLCLMLTDNVLGLVYQYGLTMQVMEVFVWTFGDANSIMLSSLLLILLFADMPFISAATPFYLARTKRWVWLLGQIIYIIIAVLLYITFTLLVTVLISMNVSFAGNMWSETGAILAFSGFGAEIAVPASIKTMLISTPYACSASIFLLVTMYMLFLTSFMLAINIRAGKSWGIISVFIMSIYGLLLNPQIFMNAFRLSEAVSYKANVAVGWLSPLNQATYHMHNFGYDYLPTLGITYILFALLTVLCFIVAAKGLKKYDFTFVGTGRWR